MPLSPLMIICYLTFIPQLLHHLPERIVLKELTEGLAMTKRLEDEGIWQQGLLTRARPSKSLGNCWKGSG